MFGKIKKVFSQMMFILDRKQKFELIGVILLILFTTLVELFGVTIIFPFIQVLIDFNSIDNTGYLHFAYELIGAKSVNEFIIYLALFFIVIYLIKNIFIILSYNFQYGFTFKNQNRIASKMIRCYINQPYIFHLDHNSAELIRGINRDTEMMFQAVLAILGLMAESLVCLVLGVFLLLQDPVMTMIVAGCLLLFMLLFMRKIKNYLTHIGDEDRQYSLGIVKWLQQSFNGLKETKILRRESFFIGKFEEQYSNWAKLEKTYRNLQMIPKPIMEFLCIAAIMIAIIVKILSGTNMASFVGTLSVFAVAAFRLLPSFNRITGYISAISFYYPSFDAVYNELKQIEELNRVSRDVDQKDNGPLSFTSSIVFKGVSFKYPKGDKEVLQGVNLTIPKNSAVAFIGPSGAGKTTLADILLGVLEPTGGQVLIDGQDAFAHLDSWQQRVGYIPQTIYLMDDTIRNNILYGADPEKDDTHIMQAVEEAQLTEFIHSLPQGLDTEIGEGGMRLSGGQRQRIGIARALYNNPDVLVLDEATSALDGDTEKAVMEAIEALSGTKTLIIIAHRLTTVIGCDIKYEISNQVAREMSNDEFEDRLRQSTSDFRKE